MINGTIFNIQKYSIHDGPGIRTTVFLKGCPLKCSWCHNPESQCFSRQIAFYPNRCIGCGACAKECNKDAIKLDKMNIYHDKDSCIMCGRCAEACYSNAIELVGKSIDAAKLVEELRKDTVFYDDSGGGVTFSGGEPLSQPEFLLELLKHCKALDISTAIDTSGYVVWEILQNIARYSDIILYDIKHMDEKKHIFYTGVSNNLILENLKALSRIGKRLFVRIPIIPSINDDDDNILRTAQLLTQLNGIEQVNLLPYHSIAVDKYKRFKMEYKLNDIVVPTKEYMMSIAEKYRSNGINVKIGG